VGEWCSWKALNCRDRSVPLGGEICRQSTHDLSPEMLGQNGSIERFLPSLWAGVIRGANSGASRRHRLLWLWFLWGLSHKSIPSAQAIKGGTGMEARFFTHLSSIAGGTRLEG
jgi:hypothetical protein